MPPPLSNIYLHVLDTIWERDGAQYGTLGRYCDDFLVITSTRRQCEQAEARGRTVLTRLGLKLHPDKTRRVELCDGKQDFDFLGCHLNRKLSARIRERSRDALFAATMALAAIDVAGLAECARADFESRCHADIREVVRHHPAIGDWGQYFRAGVLFGDSSSWTRT